MTITISKSGQLLVQIDRSSNLNDKQHGDKIESITENNLMKTNSNNLNSERIGLKPNLKHYNIVVI